MREDGDSPFTGEGYDVQAGISASWAMTPSLVLNGTINPDFSQVEADADQIEVNRRFAVFYPEKRPFFLEGGDYFQSVMPVVYTRTIADPSWGIKVTGKEASTESGPSSRRTK